MASLLTLYVVAGLVIYSRVILEAGFVFDDFEYVVGNQIIQNMSSLLQNFSDPRQLGYFSFALNFLADGENPMGYHLANVVIHIVNGTLVFFLARTLLGFCSVTAEHGRNRGIVFWFSASVGLLFIVHPLQTQAVSYVTQRFTSLAVLFYLSAVVFYCEARLRRSTDSSDNRSKAYYIIALISTVAAMKVKEISFTLPAVIAILDMLFFRTPEDRARFPYFIAPFISTMVIIPFSLFGPEYDLIQKGVGIAEVTRSEKLYDLMERPVPEYFMTQLRVLVIYMRLLIFPYHQSVVYDLVPSRSIFELSVIASLIFHLCLAGTAVLAWFRAEKSSSDTVPFFRLISIGIGWFYCTASIESSFIAIKDLIFEHRAYLPSIGLMIALTSSALLLARRLPLVPEKIDRSLLAAVAVISLVLGSIAFVRNTVWLNELNLWDDVVEKIPDKAIGYNNRGNAFMREGRFDEALADINKTIVFFEPYIGKQGTWETSDYTPTNMAKTYMTRAGILRELGYFELAAADDQTAKNMVSSPLIDLGEARKNAEYFFRRGDYTNAVDQLNIIIASFPNDISALQNRGTSRAQIGDIIGALEDFERACKMGFPPACSTAEELKRGAADRR